MYTDLAISGYSCARHYDSVSSTMDVARELLLAHEISGNWCGLVTADHQVAGRGRQGRTWLSASAAFMGTFIFCTAEPLAAVSGYSLAVGLAVAKALEPHGYSFLLKWPNDLVVVSGPSLRKLGGILVEVEEHKGYRVLLVGLGINVSKPPVELGGAAISLEELKQSAVSRDVLVRSLAVQLRDSHEHFFRDGGFAPIRSDWEKRACFVSGRTRLQLEVGDSVVSGLYAGVSELGALRLADGDAERTVHSGHILQIGWE
jgi:BirA family biotin operon repressor/biotin-[acetyl-CoA-carboxylase] ligase